MSHNRKIWLRMIILAIAMPMLMIITVNLTSEVVISSWGDLLMNRPILVYVIFWIAVMVFAAVKFHRDEPLVKETKEEPEEAFSEPEKE